MYYFLSIGRYHKKKKKVCYTDLDKDTDIWVNSYLKLCITFVCVCVCVSSEIVFSLKIKSCLVFKSIDKLTI